MRLRFIGGDGSMGLRHGQVYRVEVAPGPGEEVVLLSPIRCPYGSDAAFWRNWQLPADQVVTDRRPLVR